MKAHKSILLITLFIFIISIPGFLIFETNKFYDIFSALFTGAFISFFLELPVFLAIKNDNKVKLYSSLYNMKTNTSLLINAIEEAKYKNSPQSCDFYSNNLNNIQYYLTQFQKIDSIHFIFKNKDNNKLLMYSTLFNAYNNINYSTIKYSIKFNELYIHQLTSGVPITINNLYYELNLIEEASQVLINSLDTAANLLFTKKQLVYWIKDSLLLDNNRVNHKSNYI